MGVDFDKPEYCYSIGYLMDNHGETQEQLAQAIGVDRNKVNNWLNCKSRLDVFNLVKIAEHYKVSTDYILTGGVQTADVKVLAVIKETGLSEEATNNLFYEIEYHPDRQALLSALLENIEMFEKISRAYSSACMAYNKLHTLGDIVAGFNDDLTYNDIKHFNILTNDQATRFHIQNATNYFQECINDAVEHQFSEKYGAQLTKEINEQCGEE